MTVNIQVEGSICNLTPEGRKAYEKIREQIGAVLAQEDGLNLAMNALIATGPETTTTDMELWLKGVEDIDVRDLVGFCHGPERVFIVETALVDS